MTIDKNTKAMKKILLQTTALLLILAGMMISCGKDEINSLKGTKWKLAGIVDVQTGKLTELEPKDCEQCYTLVFDTDNTAQGYSSSNVVWVDISASHLIGIATEVGEYEPDGYIFCDATILVTSYSITNTEIKFFYKKDGKDSYLLYKFM
jgi:hypothetical protein